MIIFFKNRDGGGGLVRYGLYMTKIFKQSTSFCMCLRQITIHIDPTLSCGCIKLIGHLNLHICYQCQVIFRRVDTEWDQCTGIILYLYFSLFVSVFAVIFFFHTKSKLQIIFCCAQNTVCSIIASLYVIIHCIF